LSHQTFCTYLQGAWNQRIVSEFSKSKSFLWYIHWLSLDVLLPIWVTLLYDTKLNWVCSVVTTTDAFWRMYNFKYGKLCRLFLPAKKKCHIAILLSCRRRVTKV
jgi:hypothetical protein